MKWTVPALLLMAICGCGPTGGDTAPTSTNAAASGAADAETGALGDVSGETETGSAVELACLSDEQRALVGVPIGEAQASLPADTRVIAPGALVTQEYNPLRVNADIDSNTVVTRVWCG